MFKRRLFSCTIYGDEANEYVEGKISGIIDTVTNPYCERIQYAIRSGEINGVKYRTLRFEATNRQLNKLIKMVGNHYGNFCKIVFNQTWEVS